MPWSGGGTYTLVHDWVADKNGAINPQASRFKAQDDDMATALNNCLTRDAQGKPSQNFDFNSFKGLALANATVRTDAINAAQVQDGSVNLLGSVAGTDTITGSLTPAITVYASGMRVTFVAAATNTGAATLNVNSVAARSIVKGNGTALIAGDIASGVPTTVVYDLANTRWVLMNPLKISDAWLSSNVALLNAANTFTASGNNITAATANFFLTSTGANSSVVRFDTSSAVRGYVGATHGTGITAGGATGDMVVRAEAGGFIFTGDGGVTAHFKLSAAGLVSVPNASAQEVGTKGPQTRGVSSTDSTVAADQGNSVTFTGSTAGQTFTLDSDPPTNAMVILVNESSQSWTIAASSSLIFAGTTGSRTLPAGCMAAAYHRQGGGIWQISGQLT